MLKTLFISSLILFGITSVNAQTIQDNFEGSGTINSWFGDACTINTQLSNPFPRGNNTSQTVLSYHDTGGQYANVRFDAGRNLNLSNNAIFSFKLFVPSSGLTGMQTNQVSLKLQDGNLGAPWSTQSEVIKPILLNQWQTITVDFATDPYTNLDPNSLPPTQRNDFNRVLIQVNGENNNDHVLAYIDDFYHFDTTIVPPAPVFNQLVWSDEFNGSGAIDTSKWFHQTQLPNGVSWFNGEIQHYTDRTVNAYQSNGVLNLVAKKETFTDQGQTKQYTSARLNSKFAFTYGRVEILAKLPTGVGTWPALWMLGKNITETGAYWTNQGYGTTAWPACGEIDIMEHWGNNQDYISSATHTTASSGSTINVGGRVIPNVSNSFHLYALEWTKDQLVFSVDSVVHYVYDPLPKSTGNWPFDLDQYLLFNIAIQPSIDPNFTQSTMEVDYIRVYQQSTVGVNETNQSSTLNYFPNPVQNKLTVQLNHSTVKPIEVSIYQLDGKMIRNNTLKTNNNQLVIQDLEEFKAGLYLAAFSIEEKVYRLKFLKE